MTTQYKTIPLLSLYIANSKKEALVGLQGLSAMDKIEVIKATIELVDKEAEMLIQQGANDIAILKMSQVVMLEEVEMLIERTMLKEGSL